MIPSLPRVSPRKSARRDRVEHLLDPLFLFNSTCSSSSRSCCVGKDLGRRKQWRLAAMGGEGRPTKGEKGGAAKPGKRGGGGQEREKRNRGGHLGFCGRKKRCLR
jgi:hypothetical protein